MKQNKISKGNLQRLMGYVADRHRRMFALVVAAIIVSVAAGAVGSMFVRVIIDDYILQMTQTGENLFDGCLSCS